VVEKFANFHNCDVAFGTLFSNVVISSAPRAGELKIPYFVVSEGNHVASGMLNRYTLQPGITNVKSQVISVAPYIANNLGKKVTMIFPDYAFGYDHRDNLPPAIAAHGGEVIERIAIPPSETSFTRYFPKYPARDRGALSRDGGPRRADLREGVGRILRRAGAGFSASSTASRRWISRARASSSSKARISGKACRATRSPTRPSSTSSTASAWA
jgi:hypothetical protein